MRLTLQVCFWTAGIVLQVLVIQALLRGSYKRYYFVFIYSIAVFLATVAEASMFTAAFRAAREFAGALRVYYWTGQVALEILVFCVVISLISQALSFRRSRPAVRRFVIAAAVLVFATSFLLHVGPRARMNEWMTLVSRDLSFAAAILDLALWLLLIASRRKDYQLLMLSGGLGLQFAGIAVGHSIRYLAFAMLGRNRAVALAGGILVALANLICFYVWWQALRLKEPRSATGSGNKISGSCGAQDPL